MKKEEFLIQLENHIDSYCKTCESEFDNIINSLKKGSDVKITIKSLHDNSWHLTNGIID